MSESEFTHPCLQCGKPFAPTRSWSKFCKRYCSMKYARLVRKKAVPRVPEERTCLHCGTRFATFHPRQKFCRHRCGVDYTNKQGLTEEFRIKLYRPGRRLKCKWCAGQHKTDICPNRYGEVVKQYGTIGPNREYVPPDGVKVRYISIPPTVHGDTLKRLLKDS